MTLQELLAEFLSQLQLLPLLFLRLLPRPKRQVSLWLPTYLSQALGKPSFRQTIQSQARLFRKLKQICYRQMNADTSSQNLNLKCLNCTMSGQVSLVAGGFTIPSDDSINIGALTSFIEDGFLEFDTTNMAGNMSFELDLLPGFTVSAAIGGLPRRSLGSIVVSQTLYTVDFIESG